MQGFCFKCGESFTDGSDFESLCERCRPPTSWGVDALEYPPELPADASHLIAPFTVLVDTREQLAYTFPNVRADADKDNRPIFVPLRSATLPFGDYTIEGFADRVIIERKSYSDFCRSFGGNCQVELRKLAKIAETPNAWYVLEFDHETMLAGPPPFSSVNMKSLRRRIYSLSCKHPNVQWFFAGCREFAETATYRFLEKWWIHNVERPRKENERKERAKARK